MRQKYKDITVTPVYLEYIPASPDFNSQIYTFCVVALDVEMRRQTGNNMTDRGGDGYNIDRNTSNVQ
jgi:hypothetical protein